MLTKTTQQPKTQNTPKIRFPGFSGEWEKKRLGEVATFWNGKAHEQEISDNGKYIVVNSKFISQNGDVKKYSDSQISPLKKDDIAIVMSDIPNGKAIGKCFLINRDDTYTLNQRIGGVRSEEIMSPFLVRILNRNEYFLAFDNGVSQTNLRKDDILGCPLIFPSLPEQQKIASFLGVVDGWIGNLEKQKGSLDSYKKGMMQKIFSREIRFPGFSEKWEEKKLGEVAKIVGGGTPDTLKNNFWNGEINWFTPTEIKNKYAKESQRKITRLGLKNSSSKLLPVGTLLFTSRATIGDVSIAMEECTTNQGFQSFIVNNDNLNEFVYYWLLNNKKEFLRRSNGSTFLEISGTEIRKMKSFFPSLPEQQKIADFLTSVDGLIELKDKQITQAENWKKGLTQGLFV